MATEEKPLMLRLAQVKLNSIGAAIEASNKRLVALSGSLYCIISAWLMVDKVSEARCIVFHRNRPTQLTSQLTAESAMCYK